MIIPRFADERGHANHGWLDSYHSFSFADYHDPEHMGWGPLRVINEDRVNPGMGFGSHGHRDMEIISYVLEGALAHKDSMGNGTSILPGDVQRMSAGTGVVHSEFNHSPDKLVHFLQIWVIPDRMGSAPGYEQVHFDDAEKRGRLRLVASPDGAEGSVRIQQDAQLYASLLSDGEEATHRFAPGRLGYIHVVRGTVSIAGATYAAGDAVKLVDESTVAIRGGVGGGEVLLFDLPRLQ
ncbi:pirin family protein [Uliginosibacterium sp. sgz301328]|uniref:pirin family protein n=1 Tax=Uliginosibacterium sp. sgz301328 TaxID=3243764 RepID=UPI00359DD5B6